MCVRQAQYKTELAAWETANEEHAQLMKRRQAKQMAAWKNEKEGDEDALLSSLLEGRSTARST